MAGVRDQERALASMLETFSNVTANQVKLRLVMAKNVRTFLHGQNGETAVKHAEEELENSIECAIAVCLENQDVLDLNTDKRVAMKCPARSGLSGVPTPSAVSRVASV